MQVFLHWRVKNSNNTNEGVTDLVEGVVSAGRARIRCVCVVNVLSIVLRFHSLVGGLCVYVILIG